MPAPSPTTKPSRSTSHGRLARAGASLRVDNARIAAKPAIAERRDAGLGAAAHHRIGVAVLDQPERVADRVRPGRAGRGHGGARALGAEPERHLAGRQVDDGREDEERRDAVRPALEQDPMLPLDDLEAADAAADDHADPRGVVRADLRGRCSSTAIAVAASANWMKRPHFLRSFLSSQFSGSKPFTSPAILHRMPRGVEQRDGSDAGPAGQNALPRLVRPDADGAIRGRPR